MSTNSDNQRPGKACTASILLPAPDRDTSPIPADPNSDLKNFIRSENSVLKASINAIRSEISEMRSDIVRLQNDVIEVKTDCIKINDEVIEVKTDCIKINDQVTELQDQVTTLDRELLRSRIQANSFEQREKECSMRFLGFPAPDNGDSQPSDYLYTTILKPTLSLAVQAGDLESVPACSAVLESCFFLGQRAAPQPPGSFIRNRPRVIKVKFTNASFKAMFCKLKRQVLEKFNRDNGLNCKVLDDLTKVNLDCIKRLKDLAGVSKVFFRHELKLVKENQTRAWRILNPFADNIESALAAP